MKYQMKNTQNALFLSCTSVTELIEKEKVIQLGIMEKLRLKVHLSMCKPCKAYEHQSDLIDGMFESLAVAIQNEVLSPKQELTKKVRDLK